MRKELVLKHLSVVKKLIPQAGLLLTSYEEDIQENGLPDGISLAEYKILLKHNILHRLIKNRDIMLKNKNINIYKLINHYGLIDLDEVDKLLINSGAKGKNGVQRLRNYCTDKKIRWLII